MSATTLHLRLMGAQSAFVTRHSFSSCEPIAQRRATVSKDVLASSPGKKPHAAGIDGNRRSKPLSMSLWGSRDRGPLLFSNPPAHGGATPMMDLARAAIYARCHNEKSREGSIARQVRACHELAEQQGWTFAAFFQDRTSSAARVIRPGYDDLRRQVRDRQFDIIIASEISRLSRDQGEITALHKCCTAMNVEVWTLSDGRLGDCSQSITDTLNGLYRRDRRARRAGIHPSAVARQVVR